jgi:hypothetical protein
MGDPSANNMYDGMADNIMHIISRMKHELDSLKRATKHFKSLETELRECKAALTRRRRNENAGGAVATPSRNRRDASRRARNNTSNSNIEEVEVEMVDWAHDFGDGMKTYKRIDYEGISYIYDMETRRYLGAYIARTNKLKKSIPDPLVA